MKWKVTEPGATRTLKRFALFPMVIESGWVWLETYYEEQKFTRSFMFENYSWNWIRRYQ